jgi:hypothetical protein
MNEELKQGLEYKRPRRLKCDRRGSPQPHKQKKKNPKAMFFCEVARDVSNII